MNETKHYLKNIIFLNFHRENENENVQQRTVYEPDDSQLQVLYDAGYPPLPDAVGTEV